VPAVSTSSVVPSMRREKVLRDLVTTLQSQKCEAEIAAEDALAKCEEAEANVKALQASSGVDKRFALQLAKQQATKQRKKRTQSAHLQALREKADEALKEAQQAREQAQMDVSDAVVIERDLQRQIETHLKVLGNLSTADATEQVKTALDEAACIKQEATAIKEQALRTAELEVEQARCDAELQVEQARRDAALHVERANRCIQTAKSNLQSHIHDKKVVLRELECQESRVIARLEADVERRAVEAAAVQAAEAKVAAAQASQLAKEHKQAAAVVRNAKEAERRRASRQQRVDNAKRQREQATETLKRKTIVAAESEAKRQCEDVIAQTMAEVRTMKVRAHAQAKAMQMQACRQRRKLLSSAEAEAAAILGHVDRDQREEQVSDIVAEAPQPALECCVVKEIQDDEVAPAPVVALSQESDASDWEVLSDVSDEESSWDVIG